MPADSKLTVPPATVQTDPVVEANPTANPELAVAVTPNVPAEKAKVVTDGLNVIVCEACVIAKLTDTGAAALKLALPACEA